MPSLNWDSIRSEAFVRRTKGQDYWRSLDELAETEEFRDYVKHEFPRDVDVWMEPISRRQFLKLMSASMGLAFFSGCRKPLEKILPYNEQPEDVIPGKPLYYASALPYRGYARGTLVKTVMGRPIKIEGNPQHPDSLGATDLRMQAAALTFYDPDRSQIVQRPGRGFFLECRPTDFLSQRAAQLKSTRGSRASHSDGNSPVSHARQPAHISF